MNRTQKKPSVSHLAGDRRLTAPLLRKGAFFAVGEGLAPPGAEKKYKQKCAAKSQNITISPHFLQIFGF